MEDFVLSSTLKNQAVSSGLCEQWTNEWRNEETQQTLIEKYKRGLDFCIERNWPDISFIEDNFDKKLLADNLIYNNDEIQIDNAPDGVWILNGCCTGNIFFRGYAAATVYIRHDSNVNIFAMDSSVVFVRVMDNSFVGAESYDASKMKIITYGNSCRVEPNERVQVRCK